jgi:Family of unknown function (DUF6428)
LQGDGRVAVSTLIKHHKRMAMKISEFKQALGAASAAKVEFVLPDRSVVPSHYHVTEVGHVSKDFFDCGGTRRQDEYCALQLWVAGDTDHALVASKILGILGFTESVLKGKDLPVMVEYQRDSISRYAVSSVTRVFGKLSIALAPVFTDCLAPDQCGIGDGCC